MTTTRAEVEATDEGYRPMRVWIGGMFATGEQYPHTWEMLRCFRRSSAVTLHNDIGVPNGRVSLFEISRANVFSRIAWTTRFAWVSLRDALRASFLWRFRRIDAVLLPYPSVGVLLFLSLLPRKFRPPNVADLFISVADALTTDRKIVGEMSYKGRLAWFLERRALQAADRILCDTDRTAQWLQDRMGIEDLRTVSCPLFTDETVFARDPYAPRPGPVRVLFVGKLAPLHGTEHIAEAINLLVARDDIEFEVIGDGQASHEFEELIRDKPNVRWQRQWLPPAGVAERVRAADICLGVFGSSEKAGRVWPLKNYCAMAVGRAIVSSSDCGLPSGLTSSEKAFFKGVEKGSASSIAAAVVELASNPALRTEYANRAAQFYDRFLSCERAMDGVFAALQQAYLGRSPAINRESLPQSVPAGQRRQ